MGRLLALLSLWGLWASQAAAFEVPELPKDGSNLVGNPWFRASSGACATSLEQWEGHVYNNCPPDSNACTENKNLAWSTAQSDFDGSHANPNPDPDCEGTAGRYADNIGQGGGPGAGGTDAYLFQVVKLSSEVTNPEIRFFTHWVTGQVHELFEISVFGSDSENGPWDTLWTPLSIDAAHTAGMAWTNTDVDYSCFEDWSSSDCLRTDVSGAFNHVKIQFYCRYPAEASQGCKFTGVFLSIPGVTGTVLTEGGDSFGGGNDSGNNQPEVEPTDAGTPLPPSTSSDEGCSCSVQKPRHRTNATLYMVGLPVVLLLTMRRVSIIKKRRLSFLALLIGTLLLGVGCGEDNKNDSTQDSSVTSPDAQVTNDSGVGNFVVNDCDAVDLSFANETVTLPEHCGSPCSAGNNCGGNACSSTGLVPLSDLGTSTYHGIVGGLYCRGSNLRPESHEASGLALAQGIGPLGANGQASTTGKYAFISIGMSNTTHEFSKFVELMTPTKRNEEGVDPNLVIIDGALGSQASYQWANKPYEGGEDPQNNPWINLTNKLEENNIARPQVAVAWVKLARISPAMGVDCPEPLLPCFPGDAKLLADDVLIVLQRLHERFENLKLIYVSSRTYGGYATGALNPEPYAYQGAFAFKHLIVNQLMGNAELYYAAEQGEIKVPWLAWGPYLWADGATARSDGLTWEIGDFAEDGTHPSMESGRLKVANLLLDFLKSDSTARQWFLENP